MPAQPVMTAAWWQASITSLILAVGAVLTALGVWDPTQDQIAAIAAAGAAVVAILVPLIGFMVHNKVTPVASTSPVAIVAPVAPPG